MEIRRRPSKTDLYSMNVAEAYIPVPRFPQIHVNAYLCINPTDIHVSWCVTVIFLGGRGGGGGVIRLFAFTNLALI